MSDDLEHFFWGGGFGFCIDLYGIEILCSTFPITRAALTRKCDLAGGGCLFKDRDGTYSTKFLRIVCTLHPVVPTSQFQCSSNNDPLPLYSNLLRIGQF